jgi:hypothetical protein
MQTVERQAARLQAEGVEAAARHAREVVERVLWDRKNRWEESQRFGLDHHQSIHPKELLQSEPADPAGHWLGENEDAPRELLLTAQEPGEEAGRPGVEAGHSEAWASRPADLPRHWL